MNYRKTNTVIAAVLTAALAMSPVFMAPTSASDGQEVETSASSWRYQDGDIIAQENLNPYEADEGEYADSGDTDAADSDAERDVEEDYNAQMGSSMREDAEPALPEETDAVQPEETTGAQPEAAEPGADQPDVSGQDAAEPKETAGETQEADEPEQADPQEPAAEEELLTGQVEAEQMQQEEEVQAPVQAPDQTAQAAGEPAAAMKSSTVMNRYWTWSNGKYRRGPGYLKGIDVSYWQGKIDWKKVKAAGVDFAIIRCAYGSNSKSNDDSRFAANVKGCKANGIPYGVYIYSYANSVSKAKDEADHAIRLLKANNCKLSYPIYYDLEDSTVSKAGSSTITKMAKAFCSKLNQKGYPSGVYANLSWWNNKLTGFSGYDKWVAQWATSCTYKKPYSIWQCTSSTSVSGISGRVDANLLMCPKATMDKYMGRSVVTYSFKTIDGKVYAVGSNGSVIKNRFFRIGAYLYAFDKNGVRQAGKRYRIGYKSYILDSKGRAYIFKAKTKKKTPYYTKAGKGKKGKLKKGKSFYVLRTSGKWSQMANGYWVKTSKTKKIAVYPTITPSVKVKYKAKVTKKTTSRSGPGKNYVKKKKFKKNKTVTVIGKYGSWSKLSTGQWLPSKRLKKR